MNMKIQVIIVVFMLISLSIIINMIRNKQLELRYALTWLAVGVGILILGCFPVLFEWLSELVGIADPVNMLFFFGFCFSLIVIFVLTVAVSRMSIRIKSLAQELAIFEKQNNIDK